MFKAACRHFLNGVTHACDKCVVWPLPYLLSSPPYFVSLLIIKIKNCTFIWFLYLIYFLYFKLLYILFYFKSFFFNFMPSTKINVFYSLDERCMFCHCKIFCSKKSSKKFMKNEKESAKSYSKLIHTMRMWNFLSLDMTN
jgi:hypothetical protein